MIKVIITILFLALFANGEVCLQKTDEIISFEYNVDEYIDVLCYEYDQTQNYLTLQCIFKKYTGTKFSNLNESIYLKNKNKNKIFASYYTPFLDVKQSNNSCNIVKGILIFKIDGKWDRKIYSDYTDCINLNEYKLKNVLTKHYEIENLYFKIKEEIKRKNNENMSKYFQEIRNEFSEIQYSNFLPIKYEVLGDSIYSFNGNTSLKDSVNVINLYSMSYYYGNRDTVFLKKYFDLLFNVSNNFYYNADDDVNQSYYDSSRTYFRKLNEVFKGRDKYNETLYKEIY